MIPEVSCGAVDYSQVFNAKAGQYLGFDPTTLDPNDPNFYQKMYSVGGGNANPFVQQIAFANAAQMVHAKSLVTAQAEISQSAGLKTPRNCQGTLAQQQLLDHLG